MRYQLLSPWPDDALRFAGAVERVGRLIVAARHGMSATCDLTVPGWRILRLVAESDGHLQPSTVARRLGIARQSAHATADNLRRASMLELHHAPGDRRVRTLALTDYGAECLSELDAAMQVLLLEITNDIALDSLKTTTELLNRMAHRLRRCESVFRRRGARLAR